MCEQTEINYLDGDVVWVKLGACWWPGQVTSFENLPDDIQIEFQKKPLIAAVKFFQEDTYEFVKNLQQIYKYNCTQKDDFIKKGLDKYRTKSKDGSTYMDKFPGDVEMAEKLTGGDPDILRSEKFCREEKPDISALFGEKKISKRKREREEMSRRSEGGAVTRKITHPRFLRESDHEIRIRQQPSNSPITPKTPSSDSPQYSCNLCSFTSSRVNVIICHRKSHCSGGGYESPVGRPRIISYSQSRSTGRPSLPAETQKRKYVRKTKSLSSKGKGERDSEPVKRKLNKQMDKATAKKKKTDPELREKLLADWDVESDEDMDPDLNKSSETIDIDGPPIDKNSSATINSSESNEEKEDEGAEIIKASEKLLRETEKFTSLHIEDSSSRTSRRSNSKHRDDFDSETDTSGSVIAKDEKTVSEKKTKKLMSSLKEAKSGSTEKDDKQSRFSCFDFDEDDSAEPTITPVRKIPRIFGEKNTSVKKEILKKFTMSQALKSVKDKEKEERESDEQAASTQVFFENKAPAVKEKERHDDIDDEKGTTVQSVVTAKIELDNDDKAKADEPAMSDEIRDKNSKSVTVTELEIVEIFEVEGEKDECEVSEEIVKKTMNYELKNLSIGELEKNTANQHRAAKVEEVCASKDEISGLKNFQTEREETMSEVVTTETEDETVSELADSLRGNSENSDTDGNLNQANWRVRSQAKLQSSQSKATDTDKPVPRRRGRPRKSLPVVDNSGNGNESPKHEAVSKKITDLVTRDTEQKTSESDSERSYSGRRRKPNKRYLHLETHSNSPDNRTSSKTDESQSETEEKLQKEQRSGGRGRRGKKKSAAGPAEVHNEPTEETKDREFEFSNRTLDTTDRAPPMEGTNASKSHEEIFQVNVLRDDKMDGIETEKESSNTVASDIGKKLDSGIGSPVNITKFLSSETEQGSLKQSQNAEPNNDKSSHSKDNNEEIIETVAATPEDMESCSEATKSSSKFDTIKSNVDKLPPKKSQIKKFELSQIELLDVCAEQVAAEQAAAEKIIADKIAEEKSVAEKKVAEKLAEEKLTAEKLEAEKLAAEKLAAEKLSAEKLAAETLAAEKLAAEKLASETLVAEKLAAEKLAAEKLATEKLAAEKLAAEELAAEKLAAEKMAAEKVAAEKLAAENLAAEKLASEKAAAEKIKIDEEKAAVERKIAEEKIPKETTKDQPSEMDVKSQEVDSSAAVSSKQAEKAMIQSLPISPMKEDSTSVTSDNLTQTPPKDPTIDTIEDVLASITKEEASNESAKAQAEKFPEETRTSDTSKSDTKSSKETTQSNVGNDNSQQTISQVRGKPKTIPEGISKVKKDIVDEEIPINSFQEAFLKTLHIDKKDEKDKSSAEIEKEKKIPPSTQIVEPQQPIVVAVTTGTNESLVVPSGVQDTRDVQPLNAMTEFEGVEILVQDNIVEVGTKIEDSNTNQMDLAAALVGTDQKSESSANALSLDLQKIQDTLSDNVSSPSPSSDISVPVKKREKPRIIENVTLREPMQILMNKLLEKLPSKSTKHKLDSEIQKKGEGAKGAPRAKIMKMESASGNSKVGRSPAKTGGSHFTITRKLQVLKAEEAATAAAIEKEKAAAQAQISQTMNLQAGGEKFIQQSSQSLADMELDINSMPFVLSEDVLTPESIEHMPVVISSIIPSPSTSVPASLSLTPTTQLTATNSETYQSSTSETVTTESTSTGKKKSGTPAILKNKGKAKPTITSIKTLVPPFSSGVKGLKFQNQQASAAKAMPLVSQKSPTPGKYVIVQTAGGQQMRYSVQGKPGSTQKIAIPAGKATGSAQIVQQGGKVVILTSAQSGQAKMLPLNISKSMSGKVQKIVNNKGQIYAPISPQGMIGQKTMIAPKTETGSPTTSKLSQGQKILNTHGIITSKGVLTPLSSSKTGLLGTLSQGILTKGGIYTPISSSQLAGKTIIGSKTLVSKGAGIFPPLGSQAIGTSKGTILTPMTHTVGGKTIINAQGLVTPKGTVLTPITGQQVKAIAAKSPAKGAKVHYQSVQQKLQLPMLQKCQKIPVSSSTQMRAAGSVKSPGGGTIVFQNTMAGTQKTPSPSGKKIVRQIAHQTVASASQTTSNASSPQQTLQRGKLLGASTTVQRVTTPRGTGRQSKQKILVQKDSASGGLISSPTVNQQTKPIMSTSVVGNVTVKTPVSTPQRQISRAGKSGRAAQKHAANTASPVSASTLSIGTNEASVASSASTTTSAPIPTASSQQSQSQAVPQTLQNLPVPPLVIPGTELPLPEGEGSPKADKAAEDQAKDSSKVETARPADPTPDAPRLETAKVPAQPQIMALPTESSDGTQTYVLVTIDEQGQIQPLDNNTLMSLEGTTQNADGTRTLYIDPSSLGEAGTLDNIVLQFDNGTMPSLQTNVVGETSQSIVSAEAFPTSEIIQTSNQDILAAALANTDFQQEIGLADNTTSSVMTTGMTQTSLINQTILQSTIIPPTEPISSPSVLETSLTLNQPIMTPLEVPSSLPIQVGAAPPSVVSTIPTSLELPITITNPTISYIATANAANEAHIRIPGNSMPDIGEIMESSVSGEVAHTDIPASTQYLVLPALDDNMTTRCRENESGETASVTYSVTIPESIVMDNSQAQTTPSMPIIDDGYVEATEQRFNQVTIDEMLVPKTKTIPDSGIISSEKNETTTGHVTTEMTIESQESSSGASESPATFSQIETYRARDKESTESMIVEQESIAATNKAKEISRTETEGAEMQIDAGAEGPVAEEPRATEMQVETEPSRSLTIESTSSGEKLMAENTQNDISGNKSDLESSRRTNTAGNDEGTYPEHGEQINTSSLDSASKLDSSGSMVLEQAGMIVEEAVEMEIYPGETPGTSEGGQAVEGSSSQVEIMEGGGSETVESRTEAITEASQEEEAPSQSYEQFDPSSRVASDSTEIPTQSATKSENSGEASQSVAYESMEIDENTTESGEPPTQSYEDAKRNEASQSYETTIELNTNAPTQSFNEIMQCQEDGEQQPSTADDSIDDQSFPTQSYEVDKMDSISENLESDAGAIGQEGNIPSQSNDVGNDGIGTSSVTINNSGLNEDETASSSYVPETPENQERDQDQESAISTSSYEIPPCEELNIASSSVIPDTSVGGEHMSIHDNGVPEIPTSSYNLNPDSSSTSHVDALPTSSYEEDRVIVEQNVSTSYEVPISMPGIEENSSQNFVTESTDHRNEPTSYYARHPEVSASYYEAVNQDSNSRLEADPQEEVTPSYYEQPQDITSEASQSYFRPTPRYSSQNASPSYYDPTPETEASQSSYYSHDIEGTEQSSSRNVEASQSFYQETTDEQRLRQQGEATPTYTERYPVDYALANSPIERHDLVESSVPATRPTER